MSRMAIIIATLFALLTPATSYAAGAIHIYVGAPGRNKVPIALPKPLSAHAVSAEFYAVVSRDLELSGWFDVLDPAAFVEPAGTGIRPGQFNFDDWDVPGSVALAKMAIDAKANDQLRAEVWVYDVPGRRHLGATALTVSAESWRSLAHRLANEIIYQVTGQKGPFSQAHSVMRVWVTTQIWGIQASIPMICRLLIRVCHRHQPMRVKWQNRRLCLGAIATQGVHPQIHCGWPSSYSLG